MCYVDKEHFVYVSVVKWYNVLLSKNITDSDKVTLASKNGSVLPDKRMASGHTVRQQKSNTDPANLIKNAYLIIN